MRSLLALALVSMSCVPAPAAAASPAPSAPARLVPRTNVEGPTFTFDFPGVRVGVAEYDEGPTGTTAFLFPPGSTGAVDARGGAPGTVMTDMVRLGYDANLEALVFSGGSSYGLAAATGVAAAMRDARPGNTEARNQIARYAGAIIFDLGGRRYSTVTPDFDLGRAAYGVARPGWFPLGAHGAGRFTMQSWYFDDPQHSGQGAAMRTVGATKILVFSVVNALGSVVDRAGRVVRCGHPSADGCGTIADRIAARAADVTRKAEPEAAPGPSTNTTLTVVVTNQKLPAWALQRLAVQVHTSMARAIQPFATRDDGDVLFAVSTGEVDNQRLSPVDLGVVAGEVAWDAVLASVPPAVAPGPTTPQPRAARELAPYEGTYELAPGAKATVSLNGDALEIRTSARSLYLPADTSVTLVPVGADDFLLKTARGHRLRFEHGSDGAVRGLTIEPGPWPIAARRLPGEAHGPVAPSSSAHR
jgi:L-aminopeptidase/D-esterase-like protein